MAHGVWVVFRDRCRPTETQRTLFGSGVQQTHNRQRGSNRRGGEQTTRAAPIGHWLCRMRVQGWNPGRERGPLPERRQDPRVEADDGQSQTLQGARRKSAIPSRMESDRDALFFGRASRGPRPSKAGCSADESHDRRTAMSRPSRESLRVKARPGGRMRVLPNIAHLPTPKDLEVQRSNAERAWRNVAKAKVAATESGTSQSACGR